MVVGAEGVAGAVDSTLEAETFGECFITAIDDLVATLRDKAVLGVLGGANVSVEVSIVIPVEVSVGISVEVSIAVSVGVGVGVRVGVVEIFRRRALRNRDEIRRGFTEVRLPTELIMSCLEDGRVRSTTGEAGGGGGEEDTDSRPSARSGGGDGRRGGGGISESDESD